LATVTNIADRVCRLTGLQSTSTERTLVLEYLNDAYREAVERTECYPKTSASISVAANASTVTLSSTVTDLNKLLNVYFSDYNGYSRLKLQPVSHRRMLDLKDRVNDPVGVPKFYSVVRSGTTTTLHLYPSIDSAATMYVDYYAVPPTLVESGPGAGEESTPTAFPTQFHYRILASAGIAMGLETAWMNELAGDHKIEPHFSEDYSLGDRDRSRDFG
jgi:hypothetical protein